MEPRYKMSSAKHQTEADKEADGAPPWGCGCERRGCLAASVAFVRCKDGHMREMCPSHRAVETCAVAWAVYIASKVEV